jgi:hypothetical protein
MAVRAGAKGIRVNLSRKSRELQCERFMPDCGRTETEMSRCCGRPSFRLLSSWPSHRWRVGSGKRLTRAVHPREKDFLTRVFQCSFDGVFGEGDGEKGKILLEWGRRPWRDARTCRRERRRRDGERRPAETGLAGMSRRAGQSRAECTGLLPSGPSGHGNGHGETATEGRALRRSRVTDRCGRRMRGGRCTPASPRPAGGLRAENASVPFSETPGRAPGVTCRSVRGRRARVAATAGRP